MRSPERATRSCVSFRTDRYIHPPRAQQLSMSAYPNTTVPSRIMDVQSADHIQGRRHPVELLFLRDQLKSRKGHHSPRRHARGIKLLDSLTCSYFIGRLWTYVMGNRMVNLVRDILRYIVLHILKCSIKQIQWLILFGAELGQGQLSKLL